MTSTASAAESPADRCSVRATLRGDPMLGTAFPASRVLLVEQPGGWGPDGLADSQFDPGVARKLIDRLRGENVRVLAIRRPGRAARSERQRSWAFADCRRGHRVIVWGAFAEDAQLADVDFGELAEAELSRQAERQLAGHEEALPQPVFLVCAHGRHDVCCAVEGRPLAAALERVRPGSVWECSHLGGDRFAANVLVAPLGVLYGRVPGSAAEDLAAAADRGELLLPWLRGQVGMLPVAQAALAGAHRDLQRMGIDDLRVLDVESASTHGSQVAETAIVRIASPVGVARVPVEVRAGVRDILTCRAVRPSTPWTYRPGTAEVL